MKKIAITQRLINNHTYFEQREALDINFARLMNSCNIIPIILPVKYDFEHYFNQFDIDGVILTGGNDLGVLDKNDLSIMRDDFEKNLIKFCIEKKIPLMGMCRGMQIIADYFGSSFKKIETEVNVRYDIKPNRSSAYFKYLKKLKNLNSFHDYSIENLSKDLIVSATDTKGVIKAIEHKSEKIFAQMWHSEREKTFREPEIDIIKFFFTK